MVCVNFVCLIILHPQVIIKPTPGGSELPELYDVVTPKGWTGEKVKLKIAVKMDKPVNLKKCGLVG